MRRLLVSIILLFCFQGLGFAGNWEAVIYGNPRSPAVVEDAPEHWKDFIPNLGVGEVIRDFKLLEVQGAKRVYHALVETPDGTTGQIADIKTYIRGVNGCVAPTLQGPTCTTAVVDQILVWWGKTARDAYGQLWLDRATDPVINTIARKTLRYKVSTTCDGEPCTRIVSVQDAVDVYGETIDANLILLPHVFYGR